MVKPPILIVDDYEDSLLVTSAFLSQEGYAVITAVDGFEGLVVARQYQPGLIVLDMHMPVMDGLMFLRHRASDAVLRDIPVLVCSGSEADCLRAMEAGASDCILKPLDFTALLAKVVARYVSGGA